MRQRTVFFLCVVLAAAPAFALRPNLLKDLDRLEKMGHYEEVLYYRMSTRDMVLAGQAALATVPFDPRMDAVYRDLDRIYGSGRRTQHQMVETRIDRRFLGVVNGQKREISRLLEAAKLTDEQLRRLDERVRVYVENHLSPEFDEMGDFFFRVKAQIFERTGLFHDASFRRRLTGYYDTHVCAPYYAIIAQEAAARGDRKLASAYARKSEFFREEALREYRRSNGDRLLAELRQQKHQRLDRDELLTVLKEGLKSRESDARFAAALVLVDLRESDALLDAAGDADVEIRREIARAFAQHRFRKGLQRMQRDGDADVRKIVADALAVETGALKPGVLAEYFDRPNQPRPVVTKVLHEVNVGFCGNERFPGVLRSCWPGETVFPPNATGQFFLKIRGRLRLPADGHYRFYVKTEGGNRAVVRVGDSAGQTLTVISPKNDRRLLYADQREWGGGTLHRVDFSEPVELTRGMTGIEIDYSGGNVVTKLGKAGLRLYWSSDVHVMEPVPATVLFHEE